MHSPIHTLTSAAEARGGWALFGTGEPVTLSTTTAEILSQKRSRMTTPWTGGYSSTSLWAMVKSASSRRVETPVLSKTLER